MMDHGCVIRNQDIDVAVTIEVGAGEATRDKWRSLEANEILKKASACFAQRPIVYRLEVRVAP
jgi:hypothetical protein